MVWRAPDDLFSPHSTPPEASELGCASTTQTDVADVADVADIAGVVDRIRPEAHPGSPDANLGNHSKTISNQALASFFLRHTQERVNIELPGENFEGKYFYSVGVYKKSSLGVPNLDGPLPATLADLEDTFPRDRFLTLDVETTGLTAACDGVRTVQLADGESAAMLIFDRPVPARALVVLADFLRGRRVVAHNARFEVSWLHQAGIELVLDDTVLLFSAVRGTRLPKGSKYSGGGGGRVSLAALAAMVLGEVLDKSQQVSDWAAPTLSAEQLAYALNDAIVTHRIWEALRAELHRKSRQYGVDIVAGYEDMRFSAALAHRHGACRHRLRCRYPSGVDRPQAGAGDGNRGASCYL
jgi:ribonuclease D